MERTTISNWVRQARHRAKKNDLINELTVNEVEQLCEQYDYLCIYCKEQATTLDHAFPLKDKAPNVVANVVPSCHTCKRSKKDNNILMILKESADLNSLLVDMLSRQGGDILKDYIKEITGYI